MRPVLACFLCSLLPTVWAQQPVSLVINGGFERSGGWTKSPGASLVPEGILGNCLRTEGPVGVTQDVIPEPGVRTYSCSVQMRTRDVTPVPPAGYAYAAVYQFDDSGQLVAFRDFVQRTGTQDWQRYDYTFDLAPEATIISLRCGIYHASGTAWFDNWTLVAGGTPADYAQVQEVGPGAGAPGGTVAIFREENFPVRGVASSPERLGHLLTDAGLQVSYLTSADLASPATLNPALYNLVILPYGASFPAAARQNFTSYLHRGGSFISIGGYAFNDLLLKEGEQWTPESEVLAARLQAALEHSLLPDGGFETTDDAPVGGSELDGAWRRDGDICTIVEDSPREGRRCARVVVTPDNLREDRWYLDVPSRPGVRYRVSGWIRTRDVQPVGGGMAYMALYEYGDDDVLGKWRDFAVVRGTHDWQQFSYDFTPADSTRRLHIKLGLFRATGTAWFDDIRLADISGTEPRPMNTSTGRPMDGLDVSPTQIGVFDAGFPLRRAVSARAGQEQYLFSRDGSLAADLRGWAAAGVQGYGNARWVELLDARDRFGRKRGAAGALMINYNGFYAGSMWGFFGVENRDLFDGSSAWLDQGLVNLARFMVRGTFLRNLTTDLACYQDGETVKRFVVVQNDGGQAQTCRVTFRCLPDGDRSRAVGAETVETVVRPGEAATLTSEWKPEAFTSDLYRVTAVLEIDGQAVDELGTGFVVRRDVVARSGPELRYHDNYLHLEGQPVFLFGSDTYANVYGSDFEDPWTWSLDHLAARDFGFNLYENLQYVNPPGYEFSDAEWRKFEAMAQLTQKHGLVFMPCQLCAHNVAIPDDLLERQAAMCQAYGQRMLQYPGLLYYLNGDFQWRIEDQAMMAALWNRWLADRYGNAQAWQASWGDEVYGDWGALDYPPPPSARWDSVRACDQARFEVSVTCRWVERHVQAVRSADSVHPITSEYYRQPFGPLDLILTIDGQDVSNIGYFDLPHADIDNLPLHLRLNDLRMRGKSVSLGEYGVKTHPAWTVNNGAGGYHIVRSEEEQKQLFLAVAHYGLAMGACKVQNWCLRDASQNVFPWGVFYPNGRVPKDVAFWHRNLSLVWRHLRPRYHTPHTAVLLPDGMRLGTHPEAGLEIAFNCFRALMGLHRDFGVINEQHVAALTNETRFLIWPAPFCPEDACYHKVLQWVRDGGTLLVTGDISRNWDRQRTRAERLPQLCGVELMAEVFGPPTRTTQGTQSVSLEAGDADLKPCVRVRALGAHVLATNNNGDPLLVRNEVGKGRVFYCTDPLEMGDARDVVPSLRVLYATCLAQPSDSGEPEDPVVATDPGPDIHVCRQALLDGGAYVMAFNTNHAPHEQDVTLHCRAAASATVRVAGRSPGFIAVNVRGEVFAVGCSGQATCQGRGLARVQGDAQVIYLALDHRDISQSRALLVCPFSTGTTALRTDGDWRDPVTLIGDIVDGQWRTYEVRDGAGEIALDEDTMTCLALVCERTQQDLWTARLTRIAQRPWEAAGQ